MTYEVQFKIGDAEYTVRGPDTTGILAVIDGLEPKNATQRQDAAEATLTRMGYTWNGGVLWRPPIGPAPAFEEEPLPEIEDPHAELRKTWAPGHHWQARTRSNTEWISIAGKPHWHADQEYRRAPEGDDWITWTGGRMPVEAGIRVRVRMRSGYEVVRLADDFSWSHESDARRSDIVAYKVVAPCA